MRQVFPMCSPKGESSWKGNSVGSACAHSKSPMHERGKSPLSKVDPMEPSVQYVFKSVVVSAAKWAWDQINRPWTEVQIRASPARYRRAWSAIGSASPGGPHRRPCSGAHEVRVGGKMRPATLMTRLQPLHRAADSPSRYRAGDAGSGRRPPHQERPPQALSQVRETRVAFNRGLPTAGSRHRLAIIASIPTRRRAR
jgi:hypothetical protein